MKFWKKENINLSIQIIIVIIFLMNYSMNRDGSLKCKHHNLLLFLWASLYSVQHISVNSCSCCVLSAIPNGQRSSNELRSIWPGFSSRRRSRWFHLELFVFVTGWSWCKYLNKESCSPFFMSYLTNHLALNKPTETLLKR